MVTAVKKQAFRFSGAQSVDLADFYGLSTDAKPTENVANGSSFVEMDTRKIFLFDEENAEWLDFTGGEE